MKIESRKFRIGELANRLEVERFVIRFWEKEFSLKSTRSTGRQRFYDEKDLQKFMAIKNLLYNEGFTIAGAKKQLSTTTKNSSTHVVGSSKTTITSDENIKETLAEKDKKISQLTEQIATLQSQLIKLRSML
jgi:DNA-binding transcriptional MerR regulator